MRNLVLGGMRVLSLLLVRLLPLPLVGRGRAVAALQLGVRMICSGMFGVERWFENVGGCLRFGEKRS